MKPIGIEALKAIRKRASHLLTSEDRDRLFIHDICSGISPEHASTLQLLKVKR